MSMHEYEDLVEASVKTLINNKEDLKSDLRSMISALYTFQGQFDTGYTLFRLKNQLIENRYLYQLKVEDHPRYLENKEYFDSLKNKQSEWVLKYPGQKYSNENMVCAYYETYLYFEAGSELWIELCHTGYLKNEDTKPIVRLNVLDVALQVVELALKEQDFDLISWWYSLLPAYLVLLPDFKEGQKNIALQKIKAIALQPGVIQKDDRLYDRYITTMMNYKDQFPEEFREFCDWWVNK